MPVIPLSQETYSTIHDHLCDDGYIAWRVGTGENVELLYINSKRPGGGSRLLGAMVERLRDNPPHTTIFGFTRCVNSKAQEFYRKHGFALTRVEGVYGDGEAVVFSVNFVKLSATFL